MVPVPSGRRQTRGYCHISALGAVLGEADIVLKLGGAGKRL